jgi:hypothetical protein
VIRATPYVSVAFVNRNDGYGGDLEERIAKFIDYYAHYARMWPGLFEFVIVDWNPPPDRPKLADAFQWGRLGDVVHVDVPPEVHAAVAGQRGRKMLDYYGRNVAIRRSRGEFSLVINQDIFLSASIMKFIAGRKLSKRHFYRADRCDFDFEPCRGVAPEHFEDAARTATFQIHRRHRSTDEPISPQISPDQLDVIGSGPEPGDHVDHELGLIDCTAAAKVRHETEWRLFQWRWMRWRREYLKEWRSAIEKDIFHRSLYLHTNAAGDFLLAPRAAFAKVHGLYETVEIYLHTDTYAVVQLFAAGYDQMIFAAPHRVYHADHDRSARAGFNEAMTFVEHEAALSSILRHERSYRLNNRSWGLTDRALPVYRLKTA